MSEPFSRRNQFQITEDHWKAPSRAALRRAHRHEALPGFPVIQPFSTVEEIDAYLAGDRIQCLLCGKAFKDVGKHVAGLHGITTDEYRRKFGIPWTRALCCSDTSSKYSEVMSSRIASDPSLKDRLIELCAEGRARKATNPPSYREFTTADKNQRKVRLLSKRIFSNCFKCGNVIIPKEAPGLCDACKVKPNPEARRERSRRHYYKDLEHTRKLLRERMARLRAKKEAVHHA